jgi:hypothetical protein
MKAIDEVHLAPPATPDDPSQPRIWRVRGGYRWRIGYDGGDYAFPTHGLAPTHADALRALEMSMALTLEIRTAGNKETP